MLSRKFYKLLVEVASRRDLRATDKLLLAVLADRISQNGCCCPGMRSLAKDAGLRVATIVESLARLEQHGDIVVERQGSGRKNRYRLADRSATKSVTVEKRVQAENRGLRKLMEVVA
jgi:DNA-binding transcriptional regulator PaaX